MRNGEKGIKHPRLNGGGGTQLLVERFKAVDKQVIANKPDILVVDRNTNYTAIVDITAFVNLLSFCAHLFSSSRQCERLSTIAIASKLPI